MNLDKKMAPIVFNWRHLASIGAIWLCDPKRTNHTPFYGGFEEIGVLLVGHDFQWLQQFGLDVLLGI